MTTIHQQRRGAALIIAMVLILIIGVLAATTISGIYRDRFAFRQEMVKLQTERLIDDAVLQAAKKLAIQPDYAGETVLLSDLPLPLQGTLELSIKIDPQQKQIHATGIFVEDISNRKVCEITKLTMGEW